MPKGAKYGGGSRKGKANKTTLKAKELILAAIDNQSEHFDDTMAKVRAKNPAEWAKIMVKLMDFVLPKKLDLTNDGKPFEAPNIILAKK
jgi:hypothetical protein